jgi:hypothetical protein
MVPRVMTSAPALKLATAAIMSSIASLASSWAHPLVVVMACPVAAFNISAVTTSVPNSARGLLGERTFGVCADVCRGGAVGIGARPRALEAAVFNAHAIPPAKEAPAFRSRGPLHHFKVPIELAKQAS